MGLSVRLPSSSHHRIPSALAISTNKLFKSILRKEKARNNRPEITQGGVTTLKFPRRTQAELLAAARLVKDTGHTCILARVYPHGCAIKNTHYHLTKSRNVCVT